MHGVDELNVWKGVGNLADCVVDVSKTRPEALPAMRRQQYDALVRRQAGQRAARPAFGDAADRE